ncbi:MAG: hypothetical protein ABI586_11180, partial [Candidatus Nanopelagicales bacterium]
GPDSWVDVRMRTSYRPARLGRSAGVYSVIYRIGGSRPVGFRHKVDAVTALVVVDTRDDRWTTLQLDPVADLNSFWGGVDFRDSALTEFSLATSSRSGSPTKVVFDGLQFIRVRRTRPEVMQTQTELIDYYAAEFPSVVSHRGVEVSENTPHLNWFGNPEIFTASNLANRDIRFAVKKIHEAGGVASYNHPYGSSGGPLSASQRTTRRRAVTSTLVKERLFKAEILEVGYLGGRAGMLIADYVAIWDVLSRNAIFTTGTGTTDDHDGRGWTDIQWRCSTGVWANGTELEPLQRALRSGRAWFADMAAFSGSVNLLADGYIEMGQAAVIENDRSVLDISVSAIPSDWSIVVVIGTVDEAGAKQPDPEVTRRSFSPTEVVEGVLSIKVNTTVSRFYRVELHDGDNICRVYSNPVWLLRELPIDRIPAERMAVR